MSRLLPSLDAAAAALTVLFAQPFVLCKIAGKHKPKIIQELLQAKRESDRGNYKAKHAILRRLIQADPRAFRVDSEEGSIVGLTHRSGFRIHTRRSTLPAVLQQLSRGPR